jgi:hypothetical protein
MALCPEEIGVVDGLIETAVAGSIDTMNVDPARLNTEILTPYGLV